MYKLYLFRWIRPVNKTMIKESLNFLFKSWKVKLDHPTCQNCTYVILSGGMTLSYECKHPSVIECNNKDANFICRPTILTQIILLHCIKLAWLFLWIYTYHNLSMIWYEVCSNYKTYPKSLLHSCTRTWIFILHLRALYSSFHLKTKSNLYTHR